MRLCLFRILCTIFLTFYSSMLYFILWRRLLTLWFLLGIMVSWESIYGLWGSFETYHFMSLHYLISEVSLCPQDIINSTHWVANVWYVMVGFSMIGLNTIVICWVIIFIVSWWSFLVHVKNVNYGLMANYVEDFNAILFRS